MYLNHWDIRTKLVDGGYKPIKSDKGVIYEKDGVRVLIADVRAAGLDIPMPVMEATADMDIEAIQTTLRATRHTEIKKGAESLQTRRLERLL